MKIKNIEYTKVTTVEMENPKELFIGSVDREEGVVPISENLYINRLSFEGLLPVDDEPIDYNNRNDLEYYFNSIIFEDNTEFKAIDQWDDAVNVTFTVSVKGVDSKNVYFKILSECTGQRIESYQDVVKAELKATYM